MSAKKNVSPTFSLAIRYALGTVQGTMGLFAAGTVIYEAHSYFLRFYAHEWSGIQLSGVNDCVGEDSIANGDLFDGKTFCNKPENFIPWIEVYRHHILAAFLYYGTLLLILCGIAWVWHSSQRRAAAPDPTSQQPHGGTKSRKTI